MKEPIAHCADCLTTGREETKNREGAPVHHNLAVNENLVLTVAPMLSLNLDLQFSS